MERRKTKVHAHTLCNALYPTVGYEAIVARSKQQTECRILGTEYSDSKHQCHPDNPEEHLAQNLKMLSECHKSVVIACHQPALFRLPQNPLPCFPLSCRP